MRVKEYPEKQTLDTSDRFVVDGNDGTKSVSREAAKEALKPSVVSKTEDGVVPATENDGGMIFESDVDGNPKWKKTTVLSVQEDLDHNGWYRIFSSTKSSGFFAFLIINRYNIKSMGESFLFQISSPLSAEESTPPPNTNPTIIFKQLCGNTYSRWIIGVRVVKSDDGLLSIDIQYKQPGMITVPSSIECTLVGSSRFFVPNQPFMEVLEETTDEILSKNDDPHSNMQIATSVDLTQLRTANHWSLLKKGHWTIDYLNTISVPVIPQKGTLEYVKIEAGLDGVTLSSQFVVDLYNLIDEKISNYQVILPVVTPLNGYIGNLNVIFNLTTIEGKSGFYMDVEHNPKEGYDNLSMGFNAYKKGS